ncbi:MAG: DUF881 domain-containing protein [Clostridiales Family XIII bacterium]|nr:DUF881 domain-containing protein [Clostridiales Family XIII bacterium]
MKALRIVAVFAFCIVIGFSVVVQAKSTKGMNLFVSKKTASDMEKSIEGLKTEIDGLNVGIEEAKGKLMRYALGDEGSGNALYDSALSELAALRNMTATTAVKGPGITITLDDSPEELADWMDVNAFIVHDTDIMRIISDLSRNGAEAISINGHRIYSGSTIYCNGYTVRVNGEPEARPFIIKAIGDPANISAAMVGAGSYGNMLKDYYGLIYRVEVETDLELPSRPIKPTTFRYARVLKSEGAGS